MDNNQQIIDFKDEKVRKQDKCAAKKKTRLNNLCDSIQALIASSTAFLLSYLATVFYLASPTFLFSCLVSFTYWLFFFAYLRIAVTLLSYSMLTLVLESPAVLLLFSVLGPTFPYLASIALKTFK